MRSRRTPISPISTYHYGGRRLSSLFNRKNQTIRQVLSAFESPLVGCKLAPSQVKKPAHRTFVIPWVDRTKSIKMLI
jgi:hypothetical protein